MISPQNIELTRHFSQQRCLPERHCSKQAMHDALESHALESKSSKVHAAKIVECPQNVLETRRMLHRCQSLEKAKSKILSKINNNQMLMKTRYKELVEERGDDIEDRHAGHSLSATFLQQPGFRYRSNGDVRDRLSSKEFRIKPGYELNLNTGSCGDLCDETELLVSQTDIKKQLQAIQETLMHTKDGGNIQELGRKLRKIKNAWNKHVGEEVLHRQRSLTKVHSNMSRFPLANRFSGDMQKKCCNQKQSVKRFNKQCTRPNCVACEFRLKCHTAERPTNNQVWNACVSILLIRILLSKTRLL
jgi:hypothetical protein